jgi:hypothetical protein
VLFIPTRGALRRPEELEAESYEDEPAKASGAATTPVDGPETG